jgi:putative transcriptional regulator
MAESFSGRLLVASPLLQDPNFYRTVVFVFEHGGDGAVGTVLNRPTDESASQHLPAWQDLISAPDVVFVGGPVSNEIAIGVGEFGEGVLDVVKPMGIGFVDLSDPPDAERQPDRIRVFSGYSGWGAGQLEVELAVDSWFIVEATSDDVFGDPADLWSRVLRRQPGRVSLYAQFPEDLTLN